MSALAATLWTLPFAQFRRHPTFYLWYDSFYAVLSLCISLTLLHVGFTGFLAEFAVWHLALLPVATYVLIMAHVFAHCATHGAFPKSVNRIIGEIGGAMILTKFASWEIVHRRHHRHTDDPEKDPHPAERSYWRFAYNTLINVELQLRQEYYDNHGDTAESRRYERWRARLSFVSGICIAFLFLTVLGPSGFVLLYLPAFIFAALFVIHFNWAGHNAHRGDYPIEPADLDYGWYWLGNRLFFGIYFHGTHHRLSMLFNPMKAPEHLRCKPAVKLADREFADRENVDLAA